ncbi:F-box domain [Macleaya cordata]|uniref:F-box domain n=1 Tax=Macleaya cordata TaxID=56857 RepID=A0A200RCR7_MACCD|nr:F-box domain [Macleaya cordata]
MTLNFSRRPIFPTNPSEDNLVSSIRIANGYVMEGISEKNGDGYVRPRHFNWEFGNSFDSGRDMADRGNSREQISTDILDLLPADPFGMNISATFTAITGWFEDFETDRLNFIWNGAMKLPSDPGNIGIFERSNPSGRFDERVDEKESGNGSFDGGYVSVSNADEFLSLGNEDTQFASNRSRESEESASSSFADGDGGSPHEGLLFALSYLGVQDLLSAERVCRLLRSAVQSDALLWRNIHIDQPLSERITDDALLRLANRAQGNLQSLSLVECSRITDDGLKRVLESSPRLTKLNVPGCTRLSVEGIVNNLKAFKSTGTPGIKQLRIGGRYGVTHMHFEELKSLVGADKCIHPNAHKPRFYNGHYSLPYDDDRAIDIEICPRCQNLRLVYDCPAESCQGKQADSQLCRACTICIARCFQCGRCINDGEYEETFCLELLCSDCWKQLIDCQEGQDGNGGSSSKHAIFHEETRYCLRLYG